MVNNTNYLISSLVINQNANGFIWFAEGIKEVITDEIFNERKLRWKILKEKNKRFLDGPKLNKQYKNYIQEFLNKSISKVNKKTIFEPVLTM